MSPVGFYNGNWNARCPSTRQRPLPAQRAVRQTEAPPVRFGFAVVLNHITDQAFKILFFNALKGILDEVEVLPVPDDLKQDTDFLNANQSVEESERAWDEAVKQKCLKKAEKYYKRSALTQQQTHKDYLSAANCWMYAAGCAKASNSDQGIVDLLCEKAGTAFETSRKEILTEREELIKPYKLTHLSRLFCSSPALAILAQIYRCSQPGGRTAKMARAYLIKIGYGQQEWERVQRNEQLAEWFNKSAGLLDTISSLHSNPKWKVANFEPILPTQMPLPIPCSSLWGGGSSRLKQAISRIIGPYTSRRIQKNKEDMV